ncbi:glycoside hydrolase family 105 protein [Sphingomonas sp. R86521]|uniref:glycoside hydrolase family 88/105 protein n=1 Tax=Sphingomonas sp. R86521 TaxID=3093860 RepID=UPI0036D3DDA6
MLLNLFLAAAALVVNTPTNQVLRASGPSAANVSAMPTPAAILASTERVANWQLDHRATFDHMPAASRSVRNPRDWQQATFWAALTDLADRSRDPRYGRALLDLGRAERWRLGDKPFHADDQVIAQAWIWAAAHGGSADALAPAKAYFEAVFRNRPTGSLEFLPNPAGRGDPLCTNRWCWADALFMAPPTLLRLGLATRDARYARFAHEEFRATTDYLYDRKEHLFFRDSRFFDRRDSAGRKLFWSRGNGWVMAGLVRILQELPNDDPRRTYYVDLFRDMAKRIVALQKADGYWAPSLLDNAPDTPSETSGTAFFTYALAWGVDSGLLARKIHRPAAIRGWAALGRSVQPDGMLGWVQQVSDRPDRVSATDTQFYGSGAYVLAGTAMYDLARHGDTK